MRDTVEVSGVVLLSQPVGEFDKRLVILTRERGKITAFARGARRPKSPLIAVTGPFVFARFSLYEGRDAYTLAGAEAVDYLEGIARQMPGVFYGYYFLELADYYGREGIESDGTVRLLYAALRAILKEQMPPELIRGVFEIRMLVENGDYAPPEEEGSMGKAAFQALYHAAYAPYGRLFSFVLEEKAQQAFLKEVSHAMRAAVDKTFKSLAVLADLR